MTIYIMENPDDPPEINFSKINKDARVTVIVIAKFKMINGSAVLNIEDQKYYMQDATPVDNNKFYHKLIRDYLSSNH